jgi:hypothetical protein
VRVPEKLGEVRGDDPDLAEILRVEAIELD